MSPDHRHHVDTVVIGGGVAALWTAHALHASGRPVVVLTNAPLGSGQSLAAQGVIHGGLKYAAGGKLTDASEALAAMPQRWLDAREGRDPVDLRGVIELSDHQILWSLPGVLSRVVSFFGSKSLRGRVDPVEKADAPAIFASPAYRGRLFRLEEPVLDPVSIIRELARPLRDVTWQVEWGRSASLVPGPDGIDHIRIGETHRLSAERYVFAAGSGNAGLLSSTGREGPAMQVRPLHQLVIRRRNLPPFYSVCIGHGPKPPLVSTTHSDSDGRRIWYIGGDIAEKDGVARSEAEQVRAGQDLFSRLMPWVDLDGADWFTIRADRAEPQTSGGTRPPGAYCDAEGNIVTAWPNKLALAPDLADQVAALPGPPVKRPGGDGLPGSDLPLPRPDIALPPWDLPGSLPT